MSWSVNPEYKEIKNNPVNSGGMNIAATQEAIREILKDGTPSWITHPSEWKNFAKEICQSQKEDNDAAVSGFRMDDQDILVDFRSRNINIISTKDFVLRLRENGVRCFALYNGLPGTVGLWCVVPTEIGSNLRYICYMQTPAQIEWSVLNLDEHGLPAGEAYRGWRTVVSQLIRRKILTEERAHEIFGHPTESIVSRRYRRTLWEYRHRKFDIPVIDGM